MAERRALRVYEMVLILGVGWLAGRLPQLVNDVSATERAFRHAAPRAETPTTPISAGQSALEPRYDVEAMMAGVAARVAQETVENLLAAGWQPVVKSGGSAATVREVVVRTVDERRGRPGFFFDLPPGGHASSGENVGRVGQGREEAAGRGQMAAAPPAAGQGEASTPAYRTATEGYAAIAAGDRRKGARLLAQAAAQEPSSPRAAQWRADSARLTRHWTVAGYSLLRDGSGGLATAASPVLGGGQTAFAVGYTLDPLAKRPVSIVGRMAAASGGQSGVDTETTEAAIGVRYQLLRGVAIDVERRFALGTFARNAWSARISGGLSSEKRVLGRSLQVDAYAEGGLVGFSHPDFYVGAQVRGATPVAEIGRVRLDAGAGLWGATQQTYGQTASRVDVGPSARFRLSPWPVTAQIDYRLRAVGNAEPGSGPVFTVSGAF